MEENVQTFGQMLAEGMRLKGLDYRTLAKLVGVSHGYLWQLVNAEKRAVNDPAAKRKRPSEAVTRQLAESLDLDPRALLEAAGYQDPSADPLLTGPTRYASYPTTARQLYQDGLAAAAKGQPDRAVALLEAAVERGGISFVHAHAGLGMAHFQAGRYVPSIAEFDAALAALEEDAAAQIEAADLYYNRGLAYQRLARQQRGPEQAASRRLAAADFRRAIALEGESQDLYHSAICYLWLESNRPRRILPYGRSFLHRQATGPARHTTAALDVSLFLAFAYAACGSAGGAGQGSACGSAGGAGQGSACGSAGGAGQGSACGSAGGAGQGSACGSAGGAGQGSACGSAGGAGQGMELVDLTLQLCPNYWFAHYVKAALLAGQTHGAARRRAACAGAGIVHVRRAIQLNPSCRGHFKAELAGDFKNWAAHPEFLAVLAGEEAS